MLRNSCLFVVRWRVLCEFLIYWCPSFVGLIKVFSDLSEMELGNGGSGGGGGMVSDEVEKKDMEGEPKVKRKMKTPSQLEILEKTYAGEILSIFLTF